MWREEAAAVDETLTGTQKWVLVITVLAFGLMIFSVIPWSSLFTSSTGPADDYVTHTVAGGPAILVRVELVVSATGDAVHHRIGAGRPGGADG